MYSSLSLLVVLLLPNIATSAPLDESSLASAIQDSDEVSPRAITLLYNTFLEVTNYECDRGAASCPAWRAVNLLEALEIGQVNCDEEAENSLCEAAVEMLSEDGEVSDVEMLGGDVEIRRELYELGKSVPVGDYPLLNAIRDAIVGFVCEKEAEECELLKTFVGLENELEENIADEED